MPWRFIDCHRSMLVMLLPSCNGYVENHRFRAKLPLSLGGTTGPTLHEEWLFGSRWRALECIGSDVGMRSSMLTWPAGKSHIEMTVSLQSYTRHWGRLCHPSTGAWSAPSRLPAEPKTWLLETTALGKWRSRNAGSWCSFNGWQYG